MRRKSAIITIVYITLGGIWLNLGSMLIKIFDQHSPGTDMSFLYYYKDLIFLMVSGIILFLLIEMYRRNLSGVEKSYKQLFEGSIAAIYVFDKNNYQLLEVNEMMSQKYGYTEQELLKMTVMDLRSPDEGSRLDKYLNTEHTEGRATGIWIHKKKSGELFHTLISHQSTIYKDRQAYTVIAMDIEKHMQAEAKIKELLAVYETVTSVTNDVIWEYDPDTDKLLWRQGFEEIFGYKDGMCEHTGKWILSKIHPEDKDMVAASMNESLKQLNKFWRCEYRQQCADGTYKYVSNQAFILLDAEGKQDKMVGALRDIDIRKNYEHRLLRKNEILKNIAWDNSHELRRPVSNISGIINLLKADAETAHTDAGLLEMLERSTAELEEIIARIKTATENFDLKN